MKDIPIPNWITFSMTAAYTLVVMFFRVPEGVFGHFALAAGMFLIGLFFFTIGLVGGGVAKFVAAASLWIGPNAVFPAFLVMIAIGVVVLFFAARTMSKKGETLPCSIVVVTAFVICLPQTPVWLALIGSLPGHA